MADFEEIKYPGAGGMDLDSSWELIKKDDYREAYNLIKTEYGDEGVLTYIKGTEEISYSLPAGTNKVIGFCEDREGKAGIFFVYNSNGDHCIGRYKTETDAVDWLLYAQSVLNFDDSHKIYNARIVGTGKDKIMYWTDNYNPPRKLNLYRARAYTNTSTTTSTTSSSSSTTP